MPAAARPDHDGDRGGRDDGHWGELVERGQPQPAHPSGAACGRVSGGPREHALVERGGELGRHPGRLGTNVGDQREQVGVGGRVALDGQVKVFEQGVSHCRPPSAWKRHGEAGCRHWIH